MAKIAAVVLGLLLVGTAAFFALKPRSGSVETPAAVDVPTLPEQSLTYSVTVQRMEKGRPVGPPSDAVGNELFGDGWRFHFNIEPAQNGSLYLLNEESGSGNKPRYNVLFPTLENNAGVPQLSAKQRMKAGPYRFVDQPGVEKLWLIWSAEAISDLDTIFRDVAKRDGVINEASQVSKVQTYLKQYESQKPEVISEQSQKRTVIKGKGDIIVALVELSHLKR